MNILKKQKAPTREEIDQAINEEKYSNEFSEDKFNSKIKGTPKKILNKALYPLFILYEILACSDVPKTKKVVIVSTLGYFISPLDLYPDFIMGGFSDDILALVSTLRLCEEYATEEIKEKARKKVEGILR